MFIRNTKSKIMFEKFIAEQNEHWMGKKIKDGFLRQATKELFGFIKTKHIIALAGVRRSGKSTILKQIINYLLVSQGVKSENIFFLNLEAPILDSLRDDPYNLQKIFDEYLALANPQKGLLYIFLDEVQFFKNWQVFVKSLYEKGNVKFFVTGSNSQLLSSDMATLLSGRAIIKKIHPFSFEELANFKGIKTEKALDIARNDSNISRVWSDYVKNGSFAEVVIEKKQEIKNEILASYYKSILYQDIIPRFEVKKTKEIESLLLYLFSNIGQSYSYNSLAKFLKIQDKTAKEYIGFFEESFLLFEISNYQYSLKKQENFPKKVYAVDNGFINAVSFSFSENYGWLLENSVFLGILNREVKPYYYRGKNECDFVLKEKTKIVEAIQVTKELGHANEKREIGGLLEAMDKFNLKIGYIITENQKEERKVGGKSIKIMSAKKWLLDK